MKKKQLAVWMAAAAALTGVCGGTMSACAEETYYDETVTLTLLVDQGWLDTYGEALEALSDAALEKYNIEIDLENKTNGSDGDNLVKTRLAAGEMTDLLIFNSGAQLTALNPAEYFVDLTDYDFMDNVQEIFKESVTIDGKVYGTPVSSSNVAGIVYNKQVYEDLGLEIPKTWDEFLSNMEACEAAGYTGIMGTCGDAWSSQYTFLADYYNVAAAEPDFAAEFEAGTAKFATTPAALRSWEKLSDLQNHMNSDYMATTVTDGFDKMLEENAPVHWPMTSQFFSYMDSLSSREDAEMFGIFPIPSDDESVNGFTVWMPNGLYINNDSENVEAALTFMEFWVSEEGMDVFKEHAQADGPYLIEGVELPEDSYEGVLELQSYFDEGKTGLALEFLTALKGASCDQICVECISGAMTAEEAAQVYDEDCEKMAQQLGLEGWE
ncbi:MAG: extracellular solute-binding protein [Eubacteriales bacterium]|nr:extracellular solute-binding protein [Eubacteriales bacterium]